MESSPAPRKSFGRRLLRWIALLVVVWMVLTALPVVVLRWLDPPTSSFMLQAQYGAWSAREKGYRTRYEWVDFDRISAHAGVAVIASEDQLFPAHSGFDLKSIREAAEHNERSRHVRGASTLTQQVAKNLFLWSGPSYVRKGIEAWFTMLIELVWPKQRILEVYLNIAQFGKGVYGVEAASAAFFHTSASRLSAAQAATLAAVLPSPLRMHAERPSSYVGSRREEILAQMRALGGRAYLKNMK